LPQCSVLSDSGTDIEVIADAVGHVNSGVTRTVYGTRSRTGSPRRPPSWMACSAWPAARH